MTVNSRKRRVYAIGNWKMHGSSQMVAEWLTEFLDAKVDFKNVQVVLCPSTIYLGDTWRIIRHKHSFVVLGAQNVYFESAGAFTGEISPQMLVDVGCRYVIVGHSERRQLFFEDDALIARKFKAAYHTGLIPILCVGETQAQREEGRTFEVIRHQLEAVLNQLDIKNFMKVLIAYEPVWAIGTGLTATPEEAEAVHAYIRKWLALKDREVSEEIALLYGGSVKAANVDGLLSKPNIDGVLVGGASVVAGEFLNICQRLMSYAA